MLKVIDLFAQQKQIYVIQSLPHLSVLRSDRSSDQASAKTDNSIIAGPYDFSWSRYDKLDDNGGVRGMFRMEKSDPPESVGKADKFAFFKTE